MELSKNQLKYKMLACLGWGIDGIMDAIKNQLKYQMLWMLSKIN